MKNTQAQMALVIAISSITLGNFAQMMALMADVDTAMVKLIGQLFLIGGMIVGAIVYGKGRGFSHGFWFFLLGAGKLGWDKVGASQLNMSQLVILSIVYILTVPAIVVTMLNGEWDLTLLSFGLSVGISCVIVFGLWYMGEELKVLVSKITA